MWGLWFFLKDSACRTCMATSIRKGKTVIKKKESQDSLRQLIIAFNPSLSFCLDSRYSVPFYKTHTRIKI